MEIVRQEREDTVKSIDEQLATKLTNAQQQFILSPKWLVQRRLEQKALQNAESCRVVIISIMGPWAQNMEDGG